MTFSTAAFFIRFIEVKKPDSQIKAEYGNRISELPDEILVSILTLLTLKEAARTSILSRRWRYLWTYFTGNMFFNDDEWRTGLLPRRWRCLSTSFNGNVFRRINWPEFVVQANQIMKLHRGTTIQRFKVEFDNVFLVEDIDHWIEFIAKKRAMTFELSLGSKNSNSPETFTRIRLQPPSTDWNFEFLKVVFLSKVNLTDAKVVNYFLLHSPNLVTLTLLDLIGLSKLLVPTSCLKLKFLFVIRCSGLRKVEIFAQSIERLHCSVKNVDIRITELHRLRYLWFGDCRNTLRTHFDFTTHLYRIFPMHQLEKLGLDLWTRKEQLPLNTRQFGLPKLRLLQLVIVPCQDVEMLSWMHLLKAAPILHTLEIVFSWDNGFIQDFTMLDMMHGLQLNGCIKVVRVKGFLGLPGVDTRVVKTLIKNVKSLKKLIIVPYKRTELTNGMKKQMDDSIAQLCDKKCLPPTVGLVIQEGVDCKFIDY